MSGFMEIVGVVLPLLGTAGLGWIAGRLFGFPADAESVLSRYVLWLAGPAALFLAIMDSKLSSLLDARLLLASFLTYLIVFSGLLTIHGVALDRKLGESAFAAFSVAKFNLVMIGLPVVFSIVGTQAAPAVVINAFLGYFLLTSVTLLLYGLSNPSRSENLGGAAVFLQAFGKAFTNPLILGSLFGLLLLVLGVELPPAVRKPVSALGSSVVPVGLIAVGMSVRNVRPKDWTGEVWLMALAKVLVVPAIALGFAFLLGLRPASATSMVLLFGGPSAVVAYVLAKDFGAYEREASKIVVLTTLLAAITIPLVALACRMIWSLPGP